MAKRQETSSRIFGVLVDLFENQVALQRLKNSLEILIGSYCCVVGDDDFCRVSCSGGTLEYCCKAMFPLQVLNRYSLGHSVTSRGLGYNLRFGTLRRASRHRE